MKLKCMDKAIIFISVMFFVSEILLLWEIIRGLEFTPRVIGMVILPIVEIVLVISYLKHRHEYR